jgi:hypothetical protein
VAVKRVQIDSNSSKSNHTRSNFIRSKLDFPGLEKFEMKYGFEGFDVWNNFPYRNFLKFKLDFELKFREAFMS